LLTFITFNYNPNFSVHVNVIYFLNVKIMTRIEPKTEKKLSGKLENHPLENGRKCSLHFNIS
jgi:hypothetical protein